MIKVVSLVILLLLVPLLSGCATGTGGGGFDPFKLIQNPMVAGILVIVVVWYMFTHRKK
ncbi:MAG: hypothetical protein MUO97_05910 [Dehalococcoidia bacterium]|nr:hypothetical protein [Dehalococcoidia bacterium]